MALDSSRTLGCDLGPILRVLEASCEGSELAICAGGQIALTYSQQLTNATLKRKDFEHEPSSRCDRQVDSLEITVTAVKKKSLAES